MVLRKRSRMIEAVPEGSREDITECDRSLSLLAEGMVRYLPEVHGETYQALRLSVERLSLRLREKLPEDDKIEIIRGILREMENYRAKVDGLLRERLASWRALTSYLVRDLMKSRSLDPTVDRALTLTKRVASLLTAEEIQGFQVMLADYLRIGWAEEHPDGVALSHADRSTANDNAAGLRGGGAAAERVRQLLEKGTHGYVVLFRLGALDMIGKRFGWEAVQDSLMAVSAFLTHSLRSDDAIYHWSDSSLLAVLTTPASEPILSAAMRRIVENNRDITIQIGMRTVMLRVPLQFQITPLSHLGSADDLNRL